MMEQLLLLYYTQHTYSQHAFNAIYTITDFKSFIAHNFELLNGSLAASLNDCIEMCCYTDHAV